MSRTNFYKVQLSDIKIFCISLIDAKARRDSIHKMQRRLNLNLEFIDAVDGRGKSNSEMQSLTKRKIRWSGPNGHRDAIKTSTHAACSLSHITVWEKIIKENLDHAIIIEDDVTSRDDCILDIPKEAEFVYLSTRANRNKKGEAIGPICGAEAYYLTKTCASKLLEINEEVKLAVDIQWLPQVESLININHFITEFTNKNLPIFKAYVLPEIFTLTDLQHQSQVSPRQQKITTNKVMIPVDIGTLVERLITLQGKIKFNQSNQIQIAQSDVREFSILKTKWQGLLPGVANKPRLTDLIHQLKESIAKLNDTESKLLSQSIDSDSEANLIKIWRTEKLFKQEIMLQINEFFQLTDENKKS